ncbi:MAG: putative membrane protein YfcA, partial [Candidatus Nanohaloarchaea archaeon]
LTGVIVTYREFNELNSIHDIDLNEKSGKITTVVIGILVGFIGGLTGIGGPALSIPILVIVGIPVLEAIGAGLVQGFFVTTSTAVNYINSGKISTSLLLIMGAPYVLSQIFGWYYAQNTDTRKLKIIVSLFLALSGLYLVFV